MKATGEVMAIDRSFEGGILKAIRSLEIGQVGLRPKNGDRLSDMEIEAGLTSATDQRLFLICEAFHRGMMVDEVADLSNVDPWFLVKLQKLVQIEDELRVAASRFHHVTELAPDALELLLDAKRIGFSDRHLADVLGVKELHVRDWTGEGYNPAYKMVDTCAAEFEAATPYFYSCCDAETEEVAV
jgi:carbamoyl-phosphate synthase large subunit